jgi:hypothetical protein
MTDYTAAGGEREPFAPANAREAARWLLEQGQQPVPVPPGRKGPHLPGWQDLRVTPGQVDDLFDPRGNIGVLLGEPSGGLVDVDLDSPEARRAARHLLPPTGRIGGRRSAPDSHYFYVVDAPPQKATQGYTGTTDTRANGEGRP